MRAAAIQMVSAKTIDENLPRVRRLLCEVADAGAQLVVLPENFALFGRGRLRADGERESDGSGPILQFLREQARDLGLWIVGGTLPLVHSNTSDPSGKRADGERIFAACCVIDSSGDCAGRYDKIHLFDADVDDGVGSYRESDTICPGAVPCVVDTPWGKLGVGVCYDLRFPEYFRLLIEAGAEIIALPSAFTYKTGEAHWDTLLRARAIETQCFVIGAGQGGRHDKKRHTWGGSSIIDPWGAILARVGQGEGVVVADLDMGAVGDCRRRMPIAAHRLF